MSEQKEKFDESRVEEQPQENLKHDTPSEHQAQDVSANEEPSNAKKEKKRKHHSDEAAKLQELGDKLIEANDKYVRLYSEYENYRKRTSTEKADLIVNGAKDMMKAILPVVDDMERALAAMADDDASKEGIQLIYNKLMNTLTQKGLRAIEAKGAKFDENEHEAITRIPAADESQKNQVVDVVLKGYYLNDKVIRYAQVVVAV